MKRNRRTYYHLLDCGHQRTAFSKKPGPGFVCAKCKCLRTSITCSDQPIIKD